MFQSRFDEHMPELQKRLFELYGANPNFHILLNSLVELMKKTVKNRSAELLNRDSLCKKTKDMFPMGKDIGITFYVDLFSNNLLSLESKIPYLKSLGISYVHLMPLFKSPNINNDGGYAISSYRDVQAGIGTIEDLAYVIKCFHKAGIRLVLDFVFNHTSDEHVWAQKACDGISFYQNFYYIIKDTLEMESWNKHLREIFPDTRRGSFTYVEKIEAWVWTTFNSFQWDLNYSNPDVFLAMCKEMLFLANLGVDVLRLDALAFVWKEKGSSCENLPKAHTLIQAFRYVALISCPSLDFKSEAIVHPNEVVKYIDYKECRLSYNPLQMALFWEALATRNTRLLTYSLAKRWTIPDYCAWVNYLRCHDDIGWTFSDEDAQACGINGYDHRYFLNAFYTGRFKGSFARGEAFQYNPETGDSRVCGSLASLAGLEQAFNMYLQAKKMQDTELMHKSELYASMAIARITMLFSVVCALPGIPLLYANDEYAALNDYGYRKEKIKKTDSRWVHRIKTDWDIIKIIQENNYKNNKNLSRDSLWIVEKQASISKNIKKIFSLRSKHTCFNRSDIVFLPYYDTRIFAFERGNSKNRRKFRVWANFSEDAIKLQLPEFYTGIDLLTQKKYSDATFFCLDPYQVLWFLED